MSGPLSGTSVLVTRPAHQAAGLAEPLQSLGATVYSLPATAVEPALDPAPLDEALLRLERYDWVVLTSVNGVNALKARVDALGVRNQVFARRLAAVGSSTGTALEEAFRKPDFVPQQYVGQAVAEGIREVAGRRFLLVRAESARPELPAILRERGGIVDDVAAYRLVRPSDDSPLPEKAPDWITLTSSSSANGTRDALAARGKESWMRESLLACIGPTTAATVRELGYEVTLMAEEHTISGLVTAIAAKALLLGGGQDRGLFHA